ncbi:uncharacterized protein LOC135348086 isoform X1 [Halichondria panicea]|uniref:uncharacterized protein LOC135348086 isoform X1 n=1 Tax=Halichondria panicea TaxID=6063 RepID=UPI00312B7B04
MPGKSRAKQRESKAGGTKKLTDSYIFPDGEKYVGEYVDYGNGVIERNGEGTHSFASGLVYKGTWSKDKMNGTGELIHPNDCTYKVYNTTHCSYRKTLRSAGNLAHLLRMSTMAVVYFSGRMDLCSLDNSPATELVAMVNLRTVQGEPGLESVLWTLRLY